MTLRAELAALLADDDLADEVLQTIWAQGYLIVPANAE